MNALGVKGILIKAAEQGYITQLACKMPECFCPEELGGACYFEQVNEKSDWSPTHEHFPISKREGGHRDDLRRFGVLQPQLHDRRPVRNRPLRRRKVGDERVHPHRSTRARPSRVSGSSAASAS